MVLRETVSILFPDFNVMSLCAQVRNSNNLSLQMYVDMVTKDH